MIIRSPKWLKKLLNFEIHIGEDIKGHQSKSDIRNLWKKKWNECTKRESQFRDFYKDVYNEFVFIGDIYKLKEKHKGDFTIFLKFDEWKNKKIEEEKRQESIRKELEGIYQDILSDYRIYKDGSRAKTPKIGNVHTFEYILYNRDKITLNGIKLTYINKNSSSSYTLNLEYSIKFNGLRNAIIDDINKNYNGSKNKDRNHPKYKLYETLKETINQRKSQLKDMKSTDPDRKGLENELHVAENRLKDIKEKYKFN